MEGKERVGFINTVENDLGLMKDKLNVLSMALGQTVYQWRDEDIGGLATMISEIQDHFTTVDAYCYQAFKS